MFPRSVPLVLAALTLAVSGCSSQSEADDGALDSTATGAVDDVRVKIPTDRPFYGERSEGRSYRTSGLEPQGAISRPFTSGVLLEGQLDQPTDKRGIMLYERDGKRYDHPVAIAQYALGQLDHATTTGTKQALRRARGNADRLIQMATVVDGGLYFAYPFDFPLGGRERQTIRAPWWSAMAQGEALSLFVRLHELTGEQKWRTAADKTFATLDDRGPRKRPWSVYVDRRNYLWFEEYAGNTRPMLVLNGHMFAMFGIYDYQRLTGSEEAATLFDAGATTLREYLPSFRVQGDVSYYCARLPFCHKPLWQNEKYHGIVERQMRYIADMTDDRWFARQADRYARDYDGWPLPPKYG